MSSLPESNVVTSGDYQQKPPEVKVELISREPQGPEEIGQFAQSQFDSYAGRLAKKYSQDEGGELVDVLKWIMDRLRK